MMQSIPTSIPPSRSAATVRQTQPHCPECVADIPTTASADLSGSKGDASTSDTVQLSRDNPSQELGLIPPPGNRGSDRTGWSVRAHFINDNMPSSWSRHLVREEYQTPRSGGQSDDDGFTSNLAVDGTIEHGGGRQTVVGGRLQMVTETGSWRQDPDFQGRRTDIGEVYFQQNRTRDVGQNGRLTTGLGGGLQLTGNLGGEAIQRAWHERGPFGGRTGDRLQGQQTSESIRVRPMVSGGLGYEHDLLGDRVRASGSLQGSLPLGAGLAVARAQASLTGRAGPLEVEAGVRLEGAYSSSPELAFQEMSGVHPGAFARVELGHSRKFGVFGQLEAGGFRNEAILGVGLRFGLGGGPQLDPAN